MSIEEGAAVATLAATRLSRGHYDGAAQALLRAAEACSGSQSAEVEAAAQRLRDLARRAREHGERRKDTTCVKGSKTQRGRPHGQRHGKPPTNPHQTTDVHHSTEQLLATPPDSCDEGGLYTEGLHRALGTDALPPSPPQTPPQPPQPSPQQPSPQPSPQQPSPQPSPQPSQSAKGSPLSLPHYTTPPLRPAQPSAQESPELSPQQESNADDRLLQLETPECPPMKSPPSSTLADLLAAVTRLQAEQEHLHTTLAHTRRERDRAVQAEANLRKLLKQQQQQENPTALVEIEKEWLAARVTELEDQIKAAELVDGWEVEQRLAEATAPHTESDEVAALRREILLTKLDLQRKLETEKKEAAKRELLLVTELQRTEAKLSAEELKVSQARAEADRLQAQWNAAQAKLQAEVAAVQDKLSAAEATIKTSPASPASNPTGRAKMKGKLRLPVSPETPLTPSKDSTTKERRKSIADVSLSQVWRRLSKGAKSPSPASSPRGSPSCTDGPSFTVSSSSLPALPSDAPSPATGGLSDAAGLFEGTPLSSGFLPEEDVVRDGKTIVAKTPLPAGLSTRDVFSILFADSSSFCGDYFTKRGEYVKGEGGAQLPVRMPPWERGDGNGATGWRSMDCITVIQAPWSQHTRLEESQRYALLESPTSSLLLFHVTSATPQVTYGDYFRCEVLVMFEQPAGAPGCTVEVVAHVHFVKSTMMRGKISSTALGEMKSSYKTFVSDALEVLSRHAKQPESVPVPPLPTLSIPLSGISSLFDGTPLAPHFTSEDLVKENGKCIIERQPLPPGVTIAGFYNTVLADDSPFCGAYHTKHGEYIKGANDAQLPCTLPAWDRPEGTVTHGWRKLECMTIVQAPFSQHTPFVEYSRYASLDGALYFHTSGMTPEVMYGEYFRCEALVVVTEESAGCYIEVFALVHFVKSTLMRGKITSTATNEMTASYSQFVSQAITALQRPRQSIPPSTAPPDVAPKPSEVVTTAPDVSPPASPSGTDPWVYGVMVVFAWLFYTLVNLCSSTTAALEGGATSLRSAAALTRCLVDHANGGSAECDVAAATAQLRHTLQSENIFTALLPLQTQLSRVLDSIQGVTEFICFLFLSLSLWLLVDAHLLRRWS